MRNALRILVLLVCGAACTAKEAPATSPLESARTKVIAAAPSGWSAIATPTEDKRYTAEYFTHSQMQDFILLGPAFDYVEWKDKQGASHRDYICKECIHIWIMPQDFTPRFPRGIDPPPPPKRLFSLHGLLVYGDVMHHIDDTDRWAAILKEAKEILGHELHPSWNSWKQDIVAALKK